MMYSGQSSLVVSLQHEQCEGKKKNQFFVYSIYRLRLNWIHNIFQVRESMGQGQGALYNKSDQKAVYIIHKQKFDQKELSLMKDFFPKIVGMTLDESANERFKDIPKNIKLNIYCCFAVGPNRINIKGFNDDDRPKEFRHITVFSGKQCKSKVLEMKGMEGKKDWGTFIEILKNNEAGYVSSEQLKKMEMNSEGTSGSGKCPEPECSHNKSENKENYSSKACANCGEITENLWVCKNIPASHAQCEECYQIRLKQRNFEIKIKGNSK